jgi:hypothetical protein
MYAFMRWVLVSEAGGELYKHRKATVEPVFAQNKFNRGFRRFQRRRSTLPDSHGEYVVPCIGRASPAFVLARAFGAQGVGVALYVGKRSLGAGTVRRLGCCFAARAAGHSAAARIVESWRDQQRGVACACADRFP